MAVVLRFIRDDTQEFVIDGTVWGITKLQGIDEPTLKVYTEKNALGDGDTITSARYGSREVEITAKVKNRTTNAVQRKRALAFFTRTHGYKLFCTYLDVSRWIDVKLLKIEVPSENIYNWQTMNLSVLAPEPFWLSIDDFAKNIAALTPKFKLPYTNLVGSGFITGLRMFASQVLCKNDGDVDTQCKAVITANGEVVNPKLVVGDKYVRVVDTLVMGDQVIIDLIRSTITKNGANIMTLIDRGSTFTDIAIAVGGSIVAFEADSGEQFLDVTIYYNERFVGM